MSLPSTSSRPNRSLPNLTAKLRCGVIPALALLATTAFSDQGAKPKGFDGKPAVQPDQPVILYDGDKVNDLSRFYTWLQEHKYEDPNRVFTVVDQIDGAPAIRISGQDWGGIVTRQAYKNYKLVLEFRWGTVTWGNRKDRARNSGALLHCIGEDGNYKADFNAPWIASVEYEIMQGRTGDIILVSGYERGSTDPILPRLTMQAQPEDRYWDPKGEPREFVSRKGHLHWYGRDREWKDVIDFYGDQEVEKPTGEWNHVEAVMKDGDLVYYLNGVKVMEGTKGSLTEGRLLFQSEGAEIFFRKIELHPLAP